MKLKLTAVIIIAASMATSAMATDSPVPLLPTAPDKTKLGYAVGMRMGLQLLEGGTNVDTSIAMHAVDDVLNGKPTMLRESEAAEMLNKARSGKEVPDDRAKFSYAGGMRAALLFKHSGVEVDNNAVVQAIQDVIQGNPKMKQSEIIPLFTQAAKYSAAQKQLVNETEGAEFLARNAKNPDVKTLPDGLQYQIIKDGNGQFAKPDDLIFVSYRGTSINGVVFDQHPHFLTRTSGGIQGWKDVLPKMSVGSEWKIYVPANLAFGHRGESFHGIAPDAALIYDLTLVSIAPPGANYEVSSGLGRGLDIGASAPESNPAP